MYTIHSKFNLVLTLASFSLLYFYKVTSSTCSRGASVVPALRRVILQGNGSETDKWHASEKEKVSEVDRDCEGT